MTFQGAGNDLIGLEIDATHHGLERLLAVLAEARNTRPNRRVDPLPA